MAKQRASRDAKLSLITIVGLDEPVPGTEVFKLREYVKHVEYRVDDALPNIPYEGDDDGDNGDDNSNDESD